MFFVMLIFSKYVKICQSVLTKVLKYVENISSTKLKNILFRTARFNL